MTPEPFFRREGDVFLPQRISAGPWDPKSLHGRVVIGLLAWALERDHGDPNYLPARLTTDMYRLPGFDPVTVITRVVRAGKRIKVIDAEFFSGGVSVGRATSQFLLRGEEPAGNRWRRPAWNAPPPATLEPRVGMNTMFEIATVNGNFTDVVAGKQCWVRDIRPLVDDQPLTPFQRVALAADLTSPLANFGDQGLGFINSDATAYLSRLPTTEWIGFEVGSHQSAQGVAVVDCFLHDEAGPIGSVSACALGQRMMG
jgi:hypothetical protein